MARVRRPTAGLVTAGLALALAMATIACFWPVLDNGFVRYDDQDYVTENPQVQSGLTLRTVQWAFTTGHAANWHPLTWLSHMLDFQLFGLDARGHHLASLLFHAANSVLLFLLLRGITGAVGASWFTAGLFALHPLRVESVAWVAERKDVLSAFFFLLTLLTYVYYARTGGEPGNPGIPKNRAGYLSKWIWYLLALAFFAAGLMSKPMLVTLPCVLLLLDYWPLGRTGAGGLSFRQPQMRRLLLEKLPFFILSFSSSAVTLQVQTPAKLYFENLPFAWRAANAVVSGARYLGKIVWPQDLAVLYPHPGKWPGLAILGSGALLVAITALSVWQARRRPYLLVGWGWFLGMLVPVLGFVQVGVQSIADRYTYLPAVGIFLFLVWGAAELAVWRRMQLPVCAAIGCLVLATCAAVTWSQCRIWKDTESLFTHAAAVTRGNWVAHYSLALLSMDRYQNTQRGSLTNQVLYLNAQAEGSAVRANAAAPRRDYLQETILHCQAALQARPGYADAHATLAKALTEANRLDEARQHLETAIRLDPRNPDARQNLAELLHRDGQIEAAVTEYRQALALKRDWPAVMNNLAWILATHPADAVRDGAEAVRLAERACQLTGHTNIWFLGTLAAAWAEHGDFAKASITAGIVVNMTEALGQPGLIEKAKFRAELYRSGQALRDP
jgi:Flp pilus assembly protein TadD